MRIWRPDDLAAASAAIERARGGRPTVLLVDGEPGAGKTSFLDAVEDRADGFQVLAAEGVETGDRAPLGLLADFGLDTSADSPQVLSDVLAAQRLRELIDATAQSNGAQDGQPDRAAVLLRIDDLQWADPESIDALVGLLRRASGDRLLVLIGTRPWDGATHAGLHRWLSGRDRAVRVTLDGLDVDGARELCRAAHPTMSDATADALRAHTSGNPLYLSRLLAEYSADELTHMPVLPAPAGFARSVGLSLAQLPESCRRLMQATAILGAGWQSLHEVAALADVEDPAAAAQQLSEEGLLLSRQTDAGPTVRAAHALVRAAVYQHTSLPLRQQLHERASRIVAVPAAALEHRIAAAAQYDDQLADDLEAAAAPLHEHRSFRLSAQYLRSASALTREPALRQRRWLDSLNETLFDRDFDGVQAEMPEVARASDPVRRALLQSRVFMHERRPHDAVELLMPILRAEPPVEMDSASRYRAEVVLAWCQLTSGAAAPAIAETMARLEPLEPKDSAFGSWAMLTAGQLATRMRGSLAVLTQGLADMPASPAAVSREQSSRLAWRGSIRANMGDLRGSIADLNEVAERIAAGMMDFGAGSFHAFLARSLWLTGDWARAKVNFRLAVEMSGDEHWHPMTAAMAPAIEIGVGDLAGADRGIDRALGILEPAPWVEAWDQLTVTRVMRLHASGSAAQRADAHQLVAADIAIMAGGDAGKNAVWLLHAALACVWANQLADARICVAAMDPMTLGTPWLDAARPWLRGLIAARAGDDDLARRELSAAAADESIAMPLYRAHILADLAAAQLRGGRADEARSALAAAAALYQGLGALEYANGVESRLAELGAPAATGASDSAPASMGAMAIADSASGRVPRQRSALGLTEREHDVLTLVAEGLSYAQIARNLFITQSTVGYHLSNIYAKTGVSSRHQLTEQVHQDPTAFGLAAAR